MATKAKASSEPTAGDRISAAQVGEFVQLQKVVPVGSLQARKLKSGTVALYWRYTHGGRTDRVLIGNYDSKLPPKQTAPKGSAYSIAGAALAAAGMATKHDAAAKVGGSHRALVLAEKEQRAADSAAKIEASRQTLKTLVLAYADHLKALGRTSHRDARSIFELHVIAAHPSIAKMPASAVTGVHVADMLRTLFSAGKGRTANKLRAYLRAAYGVATVAPYSAETPEAFKAFSIHSNPVSVTKSIASANRPDKNPLSADEMRTYWLAIKDLPGLTGAVLRLHLLTGAQRIEQLMRLRTADATADTIMLLDGKGRPGKPPRQHYLPLLDDAKSALDAAQPTGEFALSLDGGKSHIAPATFSRWAAAEAQACGIVGFKAKRLRSGVETLLASAGISQEVRGRLQSHGIGGVQATHYDAHDYLPAKRTALEVLHQRLMAKPSDNVVPISAAA